MVRDIKKFWIATGGTGGHIFPALAVADELIARGRKVIVSTDGRGKKYVRNYRRAFVWASGVGAKNPLFQFWSLLKIGVSTLALSVRFVFSRPDKIVAFGGYSSVPPLIAGWIWGIPTFMHEQNAAIGRANRFAMPFVKTLMTTFPIGAGVHVGLPVRQGFRRRDEPLSMNYGRRLLVTGGSLGARILDETCPAAIESLSEKIKKSLFVIHQTRPENVEKLRKAYAAGGVKNNVLSFIKDMAGELSAASLVISRAGAGTVVEMQTVGVPAVLVPLGINPDQLANAKQFAKNGGGIVIEQKDFAPELLGKTLEKLLSNPEKLQKMATLAHVPNNAVNNIIKVVES
ncbi:MAG: UDP-N-acetylglucosamine--N-acetylmuramyl-(pentapeptide) pyrophosphoryl-undecaprenol N-acetylglucosamine transferase [Rickettsiales bacterium]|jgi:UDP-N-acetylglucosamine--N-acetylmuramyl-(pentapeptide) pyrophosphoryl-undecaprenol N-acetylglucosamine transferase|nr:UDP-N-acetylglucosamine--N-acetylmuramyl-(pentapeptide) pyrophosphoryl-undecaprenol N-acetylglucosamine transferase [Rickettsiales bacterium]